MAVRPTGAMVFFLHKTKVWFFREAEILSETCFRRKPSNLQPIATVVDSFRSSTKNTSNDSEPTNFCQHEFAAMLSPPECSNPFLISLTFQKKRIEFRNFTVLIMK